MWNFIVRLILRNRLLNLIIIGIITCFMVYKAMKVEMSYELVRMLPSTDSTYLEYLDFKEKFGEDGNVMFLGIQDDSLFELAQFNDLYDLTSELKSTYGVKEIVGITRCFYLLKDTARKKFDFIPLFRYKPNSQQSLDSLKKIFYSLNLYEGLLYNKNSGATVIMVTLDKDKLNTLKRISIINSIKTKVEKFSERHNLKVHYSGLPYIRTITSKKVEHELVFFVLLAMFITSVVLYLFFKSFKAVIFPMIIVSVNVAWVFGFISLFNYKISILLGIIPALLIVIVVENCIFLLNKYHTEYKLHSNKIKALSVSIRRIGNAMLMTNLTTAIGFATFVVTRNTILIQFGVIASLGIVAGFLLTLFLVPIIYSYLAPPKFRHIKHLDNKLVNRLAKNIVRLVMFRKKIIFAAGAMLLIFSLLGITFLKTTGNIVDDIPQRDPLYQDLLFFEKHFKGIMPFEIVIDTKKKNGVMNLKNLQKIEELQNYIAKYPELSKPLSVVEVVKAAKQAYYNGNPMRYEMPNSEERNFILAYVPIDKSNKNNILNSFVDSTRRYTRISIQMANIGTNEIERIKNDLQPKIDSIFNPEKFKVTLSGTSVIFLKGTNYLIRNLGTSLLFALILIALLMALLFTSWRMVLISIIPNLIPLIFTAGMMGYLNIPIKPSTIIVFSIALGIAIDNAIHLLAKYRLELKKHNWLIKKSLIIALREMSISMMYSSSVLFLGFSIFSWSSFGGIQSLGILIAMTLLVAFFCNILILPAIILSSKRLTTKTFNQPMLKGIEIDEEKLESVTEQKQMRLKRILNSFKRKQKVKK